MSMSAQENAAASQPNRAEADAVQIVLHVPKCAGSTIHLHLAEHLGPTGYWTPPRRSRGLPQEMLGRKYVRGSHPPLPGVRAVSGHFLGLSVERLFEGRPLRRYVLLRTPSAHVLSWYNFRMMRYLAKGRPTYSFKVHLEGLPPDPMTHFLLASWLELPWIRLASMSPSEKYDRVQDALSGFDLVGDIADCDRLIGILSERLSIPDAAPRANTGEDWEGQTKWRRLTLADLSDADRDMLERRTQLDAALHRQAVLGEAAGFDPGKAIRFLPSEIARSRAGLARLFARV